MKLNTYLEREYTKVRRPGGEDWLKVDDETGGDVSGYHCQMRVQVLNNREFTLVLKNCFDHPVLLDHLKSLGGETVKNRGICEATLNFKTNQITEIRDLAKVIGSIYYQGQEHHRNIWPWSCPRTASSINRLANLIMEYRRAGKHEVLPSSTLPQAAGPKSSEILNNPDPEEDDIFAILDWYYPGTASRDSTRNSSRC